MPPSHSAHLHQLPPVIVPDPLWVLYQMTLSRLRLLRGPRYSSAWLMRHCMESGCRALQVELDKEEAKLWQREVGAAGLLRPGESILLSAPSSPRGRGQPVQPNPSKPAVRRPRKKTPGRR